MDVTHFLSSLEELAERENSFLLAVSGGIDSMVMVHLFQQSGIKFGIAHCNFQLRGEESDQDESFVRNYAESNNIPLYIKRFPTSEYGSEKRLSTQMAARELRYKWFDELVKEHHYPFIVTAHHAGDQAETMLLNFVKGKGIAALAGIPAINKNIIRPLLSFTRDDIIAYAKQHDVKWREDSSNASTDYDRNFMRHKVIPLLKELNPSLEKSLLHTSHLLAEAERHMEEAFQKWKQYHCREEKVGLVVNIDGLQQHHLLSNFIYKLLSPFSFSPAVIREISEKLDLPSGRIFHSPSHVLVFDRLKQVIISPQSAGNKEEFHVMEGEVLNTPYFSLSFENNATTDFSLGENTAFLDAGKLSFPLLIRKWRDGDAFQPLGMDGYKKISDFFIDEKVSVPAKEMAWLLVSGEEIAWVIGYRIDNRFKLSPDTKTVLKVTFAAH